MREHKHMHHRSNVRNERYKLINDEWAITFISNEHYTIKQYDELFSKEGKPYGEKVINTTLEHINNVQGTWNENHGIVHMNYDFLLLPNGSVNTIEEVSHLTNLLDKSFNDRPDTGSYTMKTYYCHRKDYKDKYYYVEHKDTEICAFGHSRLIYNKATKPDAKTYKKRYKDALKKYPHFNEYITHLYNCNK